MVAATLAYLDLRFYHPFPDGNARAARLAFDFILWQARIPIADLRPVFALPRVAGDRDGYLDFLRLVTCLCERAARAPRTTASPLAGLEREAGNAQRCRVGG